MSTDTVRDSLVQLIRARQDSAAALRPRLDAIARLKLVLREVGEAAAAIDPTDLRDGYAAVSPEGSTQLLDRLDEEAALVARAIDRLGRGRINLGAIGNSGAGKSRLLRSLTGLGADEIPDQDGGPATGVPSVIEHSDHFSAIVEFLTEAQYLDRILEYYRDPRLGLSNPPSSVRQFADTPLAVPRERTSAYDHLETHHTAAHGTLALLGRPPLRIEATDVARYVTQEDRQGSPRTEFLAVRRLVLATPYPAGIVEVGVIDLPGFGDTNLTDVPLMIDSVRHEVDVLIMVKKPNDRALWDRNVDEGLLDKVREALPEVPLESRVLLLLNEDRRPGRSNRKQCDLVRGRGASFPVARVDIVDAADPGAASEYFGEVLASIEAMVREADAKQLAELDHRWGQVAQQVQGHLNEMSQAVGSGKALTEPTRIKMANEARRRLSRALSARAKQTQDPLPITATSRKYFVQVLDDAERIVNEFNVEAFNDLKADLHGSHTLAYGAALDERRERLTSSLAQLDRLYSDALQKQKDELLELVVTEGQLSNLVRGFGDDGWAALLALLQDGRTDLPKESPLIQGIRDLLAAEVHHASILRGRIEAATRLMTSHCPRYPAESLTTGYARRMNSGDATTAEQDPKSWDTNEVDADSFVQLVKRVGQYSLYEACSSQDTAPSEAFADGIHGILDRDQTNPEIAAAAVIRQFVRAILDSPGANDSWEAVYQTWMAQIWPEEFQKAEGRSISLARLAGSLAEARGLLDEMGPEGRRHDHSSEE